METVSQSLLACFMWEKCTNNAYIVPIASYRSTNISTFSLMAPTHSMFTHDQTTNVLVVANISIQITITTNVALLDCVVCSVQLLVVAQLVFGCCQFSWSMTLYEG